MCINGRTLTLTEPEQHHRHKQPHDLYVFSLFCFFFLLSTAHFCREWTTKYEKNDEQPTTWQSNKFNIERVFSFAHLIFFLLRLCVVLVSRTSTLMCLLICLSPTKYANRSVCNTYSRQPICCRFEWVGVCIAAINTTYTDCLCMWRKNIHSSLCAMV